MKLKQTTVVKSILLFTLLGSGKFSNAQRLDVFGGLNMSGFNHKISGTKQDNSGTVNFNVGMGVFVPFKPKDYKSSEDGSGFFPSLQFVNKGTSKSTIVSTTEADIKLGFLQLNLPLTYMGGNYGIGFGPYAAYAISGTKKFRTGSNTDKQNIDFANDIKRFDYGVSINMILGVFKIQYDLGLANIDAGVKGTVKTRNFSLGLEIPLAIN